MNSEKKIGVAQVGVGYWGPNLLRNLVASKRCDVRKVIELSEERRDFVRSLYPSVEISDRFEDVLEDDSVNAVIISTPVRTHFDLAMKALAAGKNILVEKPLAYNVEQVQQIRKAAEANGLVAMVGHTFLFNAAVRYLRQLIDSGELGDVRYIYSQRLNLGRIRSDVDALWNLAPHDISIIQYLLGDPEPISITRHGMDFVQKGIDDVVFMNIVYPNQVMANVHVSWLDPHKVRKLTVVGSKKMVIYDDVAENKIGIYDKGIDKIAVLGEAMDFDDADFFKFTHRSGDVVFPQINFEEPLKVELGHFFDCIENGEPCMTGPEHAEKVVGILSA